MPKYPLVFDNSAQILNTWHEIAVHWHKIHVPNTCLGRTAEKIQNMDQKLKNGSWERFGCKLNYGVAEVQEFDDVSPSLEQVT